MSSGRLCIKTFCCCCSCLHWWQLQVLRDVLYQDSDGPSPGPRGASGTHPQWQPLHLCSRYLGLACGHSMKGSGLGPEVGVCIHQPGAVSQLRRCMGEAGKAISSQTPGAAVTVRGPGDHVPTGVSVPSTPHPPGTLCGQSPGIPVAFLTPRIPGAGINLPKQLYWLPRWLSW